MNRPRLRNKVARALALFITLFVAGPAPATSEGQVWLQGLSQGKLTPNLRLWLEAQPRYGLTTGGFTTVMLRPALGWQVTPALSLWAGYAWTPLVEPTWRDEHRAWFQGILVLKPAGITFAQRFRLEGRFLEGVPATALRARYLARVVVPVATESPIGVAVYDEVLFAVNDAQPAIVSGFDQNRLFAGVNYRFSPAFSADAGYLWNAVRRPSPTANRTNHVFMVTLYHYFDLTEP